MPMKELSLRKTFEQYDLLGVNVGNSFKLRLANCPTNPQSLISSGSSYSFDLLVVKFHSFD